MAKSKKEIKVLISSFAKEVIKTEIKALKALVDRSIDESFIDIVQEILNLNGKVILSGVGKSGLIAKKISSTLLSTGTKSVFVHPVEAMHGDIAIITKNDLVLLFSNSGDSPEIVKFAQILKKKEVKIFLVTNKKDSRLAFISDRVILLNTPKEACPHNIVPTSSTTAMLVIGDALAITLMKLKNYTKDDFAEVHPGGGIGKLLYIKAYDLMRKGKDNPVVSINSTVKDTIKKMTETSLGAVSVVDKYGRIKGFFTDGDIRRKLSKINLSDKISIHMTKKPITIRYDISAYEVAKILESKKIDNIPVVDEKNRVIGIIDERDLIREGIL